MSINDFFLGFFGFPRQRPPDESADADHWDNEHDEDDFDPFHSMFEQQNEMFKHFERQFDEIFKSFGFMEFNIPSLPNSDEGITQLPPPNENNLPLRDRLLKHPDLETLRPYNNYESTPWFRFWKSNDHNNENNKFEDKDLDAAVSKQGLSGMLMDTPDLQQFTTREQPRDSFFRSSSITIKSADGKCEERRTKRDSDGTDETKVTRRIGDRSHSVVIRRDKDGLQEHEENFVNMVESDIGKFEQDWSQTSKQQDHSPNTIVPRFHGDSSAPRLFKKLFGNFNLPRKPDSQ